MIQSGLLNIFLRTMYFLTGVAGFINCTSTPKSPVDYFGQKPPGMVAQLFAPDIISTNSYEHCSPAFAPDGSVVLWTVVDSSYRSHMIEMNYEDGKWTKPGIPSFADTSADDYYPSFSSGGSKLYFSSRRKVPAGYPDTRNMRIWQVERKMKSWGSPMPVDTIVSQGQDYAHSVTKNGTFYIASAMGGATNFNIRSVKKQNDHYTMPVMLPYNINSVNYEDGPFIAPDESFLIFESQRPEGIAGSIDLYISFKNKNDQWSLPVNMGPRINTESSERFARLSPDGKYLFFGSNRNQSPVNRGFDIYWIDAGVIDELRSGAMPQTIDQTLGNIILESLNKNDAGASADGLKKWLGLYPNDLDAIINYSSMLRKQKKYSEAEQLLEGQQSRWPENTGLILEMALLKFGVQKDEEARKLLTPLLLPGNQLRERYIYLAASLLDMKIFRSSEEYFEKAMEIFPSSYPYFNRAGTLAQMGEKERAFSALEKAIALGGITAKKDYESNAALHVLKSDPRWIPLMEKLKE